jgi:hypothetical protein
MLAALKEMSTAGRERKLPVVERSNKELALRARPGV